MNLSRIKSALDRILSALEEVRDEVEEGIETENETRERLYRMSYEAATQTLYPRKICIRRTSTTMDGL